MTSESHETRLDGRTPDSEHSRPARNVGWRSGYGLWRGNAPFESAGPAQCRAFPRRLHLSADPRGVRRYEIARLCHEHRASSFKITICDLKGSGFKIAKCDLKARTAH